MNFTEYVVFFLSIRFVNTLILAVFLCCCCMRILDNWRGCGDLFAHGGAFTSAIVPTSRECGAYVCFRCFFFLLGLFLLCVLILFLLL